MSANSSTNPEATPPVPIEKKPRVFRWGAIVGLPIWVFVSFVSSWFIVVALAILLQQTGASFVGINSSVFETIAASAVYVLCFAIIVGMPWLVKRYRTTREDIGLNRLPTWMDIGLAPASFVLYLLVSGVALYVVQRLAPGFDAAEPQEIGFENLSRQYEYILAFATLVIIAPLAEEAIFRGYLYGKLRKAAPMWVAIFTTSVLFGLLHMKWDGGVVMGLNVGLDVFILSIVMCSLREVTGSIWAGVLLHMLKNGLAFYLLFINPALLSTIGG